VPILKTPVSDQTASVGNRYQLMLSENTFTDPDTGDSLSLTTLLGNGNSLPAWLRFDSTTGTFSGTPTAGDIGSFNVKVTATDRAGANVSDIFTLTINPAADTSSTNNLLSPNENGTNSTALILGKAPATINFASGRQGIRVKGTVSRSKLVGNDIIVGKLGKDQLSGWTGNDQLFGKGGNDQLKGGAGNDQLHGDNGSDRLLGGSGDDWTMGGTGTDVLLGGTGNDILAGGADADMLTGGSGTDVFVFETLADGNDTITDFNAQEDLLDLRAVFAATQFGNLTATSRFQQFIKVEQVGANAVVKLDGDGIGASPTFSVLATLNNTTAATIGARNFIVA
jgi:hypothetical protein